MSKGLGKIERKIIDALKEREKEAEERGWDKWTFLGRLAYDVFDGELIDVCVSNPFSAGDVITIGEEPTRSQYVSVWRAVKSLEKKGIVQTKRESAGIMERNTECGGFSCLVKVKLSVDFTAKMSSNQHLKEGYIANWKKYPENEVKIRVARPSILAPSKELLEDWKEEKITWKEYERRLKEEIFSNPKAVDRLKEIKKLAETKDVRLMCYEKNPPCHRFTLISILSHDHGFNRGKNRSVMYDGKKRNKKSGNKSRGIEKKESVQFFE